MSVPISDAAELMSKWDYSAILATNDSGDAVGIVTDHDLRQRVVAANIDLKKPIQEIMSSPIITISDHAMIFEALLLMQKNNIKHLAVKDSNDKTSGIISADEFMDIQRNSSAFLIREINNASNLDSGLHV